MSPAEAAAPASSRASAPSWNTPAFAASPIHSAFMPSILRLAQANMQLAQLLFVHRRRGMREQILRALRLGERDDVADGFGARHHGDDAVQAEGDTAVRMRAVLQRLEQKSEFLLRFFRTDGKRAEYLRLHLFAVDPDRAATDLRAVQHHVVGLRDGSAGIGGDKVLVA